LLASNRRSRPQEDTDTSRTHAQRRPRVEQPRSSQRADNAISGRRVGMRRLKLDLDRRPAGNSGPGRAQNGSARPARQACRTHSERPEDESRAYEGIPHRRQNCSTWITSISRTCSACWRSCPRRKILSAATTR